MFRFITYFGEIWSFEPFAGSGSPLDFPFFGGEIPSSELFRLDLKLFLKNSHFGKEHLQRGDLCVFFSVGDLLEEKF